MNSKTKPAGLHPLLILLILGIPLLHSSCSRYLYAPTGPQMVGLQEQGDLKVSLGHSRMGPENYSGTIRRHNYNLQLAYSPLPNLGVHASAALFRDVSGLASLPVQFSSVNREFFSSDFGDLAVAHYHILNGKAYSYQKGNLLVWENSLGMGLGQIRYNNDGIGQVEVNLRKYYLQTHFYYQFKDNFSLGLAVRPTWISYQQADATGALPSDFFSRVQELELVNPVFLVEYGLRMQGGWRTVKLFMSTVLSLTNASHRELVGTEYLYLPVTTSLGVVFDLDEFSRKRKSLKPW